MATETKLCLKLLIDNKSKRVPIAEASKDVVDFLLCLLAFPVGRFSSLLSEEGMIIGSISALYDSLKQLDGSYIASEQMKGILLDPSCAISSSQSPNASLLVGPRSTPTATNRKFYRCNGYFNDSDTHISEEFGLKCPYCNYGMMTVEMEIVASKKRKIDAGELGCVKGIVTYSVMDDLTVVPMPAISSITLLNKFRIEDLSVLEEKTFILGLKEALRLLKAALQSKTVLTDVFPGKYRTGA